MDLLFGRLFQLLHVALFFCFLVSSTYADQCSLQRSSVCGLSLDYPMRDIYYSRGCVGVGYPGFEVNCDGFSYGGRPYMIFSNQVYHVLGINYEDRTIKLVDTEVDGHDCPQPKQNFSLPPSPSWLNYHLSSTYNVTIFYNCSSVPFDTEQTLLCSEDYYNITNTPLSYAFPKGEIPKGFDWYGNCAENVAVPAEFYEWGSTNVNISDAIKQGFEIKWSATDWCEDCELSGGQCWFSSKDNSTGCACKDNNLPGIKSYNNTCPQQTHPLAPRRQGIPLVLKIVIVLFTGIGGLILMVMLLVCIKKKIWRNKNSPIDVQSFLESYGCPALHRYTYQDIKKMTNSFEDKLGEGGYGNVFKGNLHDGRLVAIKVLNQSKGDGQDFINEVATIGRTNHVNVDTLLGFCIEGMKRALVYEFMPNGSLERIIYTEEEQRQHTILTSLGWKRLYEIALGIARGLDYLHRGCNTRILHFDIKPHNILLDQDFCPKISDFGLAKLYLTRESVVSTVGARGTMGYIAPELYCRNFGGVSHKSDVYSFGMVMLEMIGGRKNIDTTIENISEIYFPSWIYNHLTDNNGAKDSKVIQAREFENEMAKKMIIVALWCIQSHPIERPSMTKVVEMLEGDAHDLQIPPNPSPDPRFSSSIPA